MSFDQKQIRLKPVCSSVNARTQIWCHWWQKCKKCVREERILKSNPRLERKCASRLFLHQKSDQKRTSRGGTGGSNH